MKFCGGKGIYLSLAWFFCFTVALEAKQHNVGMVVHEQNYKKAFIKKIVTTTRAYISDESHLILIAPRICKMYQEYVRKMSNWYKAQVRVCKAEE